MESNHHRGVATAGQGSNLVTYRYVLSSKIWPGAEGSNLALTGSKPAVLPIKLAPSRGEIIRSPRQHHEIGADIRDRTGLISLEG